MNRVLLIIIAILLITNVLIWNTPESPAKPETLAQAIVPKPTIPQPTPTPTLAPPPTAKTLENDYFIVQSFNNCGPASLSMLLSYYDIHVSQEELGEQLRPWQNPYGDNDDKSVTIDELAQKAQEYGLIPFHLPNGNIDLIKQFISNDIPLLTRTWLDINDDIGHYRVIKGYDDNNQTIIQDDSYQGQNLSFTYNDFNIMWEKFNYEYLVLIPKEKDQIAKSIIGENINPQTAWQAALKRNKKTLAQNPSDIYSRFNIAIAAFYLKDYQKTIEEYEKIEGLLPWRTLWYQTEPILAYFQLKNYDKVLSISDSIINNENAAFSELYILRGKIFLGNGDTQTARQEFEKAVYYNTNLRQAHTALKSLD
jgi:predicted double-glycine peptidase